MKRALFLVTLLALCTGFTAGPAFTDPPDDEWTPTLRVPLTLYSQIAIDPPRLLYRSAVKLPKLNLCGLDGTADKCTAGGPGKFWCGVECIWGDSCTVYCRDTGKTYACCYCDWSKPNGENATCVCKVAVPE